MDIYEVLEKAKSQAVVTHNTPEAIQSAQAMALISHYFIHALGTPEGLLSFVNEHSIKKWNGFWDGEVEIDAIQTVEAVLTILLKGKNLAQMLIDSVEFGGDVDTVASLVLAIGSTSSHYENNLPEVLFREIENEEFGLDYLKSLDQDFAKLIHQYKNESRKV